MKRPITVLLALAVMGSILMIGGVGGVAAYSEQVNVNDGGANNYQANSNEQVAPWSYNYQENHNTAGEYQNTQINDNNQRDTTPSTLDSEAYNMQINRNTAAAENYQENDNRQFSGYDGSNDNTQVNANSGESGTNIDLNENLQSDRYNDNEQINEDY
ncbi:hypothetical protein E2L06_09315 [Haloterrigena sp. H1]|uniref:hypothetical protein n=1 Tax=Haloterrigena sp. H1 TaxID=2552943 RepID=UPI00110E1EE9|nr:hypothetical protein [Haloterrigena sp. H1]TMT86787.1 hypothetical protein E2L06_09315 [Haloterrigena sp. H1]